MRPISLFWFALFITSLCIHNETTLWIGIIGGFCDIVLEEIRSKSGN